MNLNSNPDSTNLRLHGEQIEYTPAMIEEYIRCKEDIIYFAEKYFYIVTMDKGKQIIQLWDFQKKLLAAMMETPEGKRHLCVLSSRQSAKTTTCTIFMLHYALFNEDKTIAILANKEQIAITIMRRVKLAYENLPKWLQQGITRGGWNKKTITFENGTTVLAASTSSSALRGISANVLLLDEFAFVPDNISNEFMSSVYPIIVSGNTTKIIMVSTPNGMNHFHDIYKDAQEGKNNYYPVYIRWTDVPGRDEAWKESVIKDIGIIRWMQEFEGKFLGSTSILIDGTRLGSIVPRTPREIREDGCLFIYEQPLKGCVYILGADPGKGLGQDYSAIQVLRVDALQKLEQVAVYRNNKIDPHNFSAVLIHISEMYNHAFILVENNGKEGGMVIEAIHYTYQYPQLVSPNDKDLGISSNVKVKFTANLNMKRYVDNGYVLIHDKQTLTELGKYEEVQPNIFKSKGKTDNDDTVTSLMWGLYFVELIDIMGLQFDPVTKKLLTGKFADAAFSGEGIPIAIIDDGMELFDRQFIDEDGTVWR